MMVGCELHFDATKIVELCLEDGILLNATNSRVVRWLPPLIAEKGHIDAGVSALGRALSRAQIL
jgi:acetylornithine/succinyldiaminopimelate/putrescine aminotransferase